MLNWDYNLSKNWKPKTDQEWEWFLVRKINYNDLTGLNKEAVFKYFNRIRNKLDPGKRNLFEYYFQTKYK